MMIVNSAKLKRIEKTIVIGFFLIFFLGCLCIFGTPQYNDSAQYISMHVHREPVYPLFLFMIRIIVKDHYLIVAGMLQSILAVYACSRFVLYMYSIIESGDENVRARELISLVALIVISVVPYIITPIMSLTHVMLSCGILSEALALPLFILFTIKLHRMITEGRTDDRICSLILAILLSLTRSQMLFTIIAWILTTIASYIRSGKKRISNFIIPVIVLMVFIPVRTILIKSYNLIFNGRYVDNVYTNLTMLTNIFYVTDRDTGTRIEDEDLREIFYRLYDEMDENEWSYRYANDSSWERAVYLEEMHDRIKFDVLEAGFRDIMNERGMPDYIDYNLKAEEYSGRLIKILFPECMVKWAEDYIVLGTRGLIRSIAYCHPIMYIYTICIILYSMLISIRSLRHDKNDKAAWMILISLVLLFGNAYGTAVTIMCLSRYMIYGFIVFYSSLLGMLNENRKIRIS